MPLSRQSMTAATLAFALAAIGVGLAGNAAAKENRERGDRPEPAGRKTSDLYTTLIGKRQFSTLSAAIEEAGLVEALSEIEAATVFAPTNRAFREIPVAELESLFGDADALTALLLYHIAPGSLVSTDLRDGSLPTLLDGSPLGISVTQYWKHYVSIKVDDARVTRADIPATNGVIHTIDSLLDPTSPRLQSLGETIADAPQFSTFSTLLEQARLTSVLDLDSRSFTVFAPTDEAFGMIPEPTLAALVADRRALRKTLLNHIVLRPFSSEDLLSTDSVRTAARKSLPVRSTDSVPSVISVGASTLIQTESTSSNGFLHTIETVLLPESPVSLAGLIASRDDLTWLDNAITKSGLAEALAPTRGIPTFTIFAPSDTAFATLPEGTLDALLADPTGELAEILKLHIVPGRLTSSNLRDGQELRSVGRDSLSVAVSDAGEITINGTRVSTPNLLTENGVVHIVDEIIEDSPFTIADVISSKGYLSTLAAALDTAGLTETLADPDTEFTLLAPLDSSFRRIREGGLDPLADILKNHVIPGSRTAADLTRSHTATTLLGTDLSISSRTYHWFWFPLRRITINGVTLIVTDLPADNGIVHVITGVLLPEDVKG